MNETIFGEEEKKVMESSRTVNSQYFFIEGKLTDRCDVEFEFSWRSCCLSVGIYIFDHDWTLFELLFTILLSEVLQKTEKKLKLNYGI